MCWLQDITGGDSHEAEALFDFQNPAELLLLAVGKKNNNPLLTWKSSKPSLEVIEGE